MKTLSYHNVCLDPEDLGILKDGQWLNDKIIGFMLEYVFLIFSVLSQTGICFILITVYSKAFRRKEKKTRMIIFRL